MKFPIAWHEECLRNQLASLQRERESVERAVAALDRHAQDVEHYARQIDTAKAMKKDGFDREKFQKKGVK